MCSICMIAKGYKVLSWKHCQSKNGVCDESPPKRRMVAETFAWRLVSIWTQFRLFLPQSNNSETGQHRPHGWSPFFYWNTTSGKNFITDASISGKMWKWNVNKANLRDLIAATGLAILLKFNPNHRFFVPCDLVSLVKFDGWPWKTIGHLFYTTSSFVYHFKSIGELKLKLQSGKPQFGSKSAIFCPVWPWNWMDDLGKQ